MKSRRRDMKAMIGVCLFSAALASPLAPGQTTSPRNLKSPTQQELLASCQRYEERERKSCEQRVMENQPPGKSTLNKSAAEQQAQRPRTENRAVEDPGASTVPPSVDRSDRNSRTRSDRTRLSQRSEGVKNAPPPARHERDPNIDTNAAPTRSSDTNADRAKDSRAKDSNDSAPDQTSSQPRKPAAPPDRNP
jgi:hypothetical protein